MRKEERRADDGENDLSTPDKPVYVAPIWLISKLAEQGPGRHAQHSSERAPKEVRLASGEPTPHQDYSASERYSSQHGKNHDFKKFKA